METLERKATNPSSNNGGTKTKKKYVKIQARNLPPKPCLCGRPGVRYTGDSWACAVCLAIEERMRYER